MAEDAASLNLAAFDAEDLKVISAQMQDAALKVGDIKYLPNQKKLALIANRFDWSDAETRTRGPYRRQLSGLQFARAISVRSRNITRDRDDAVLWLLSIKFEPEEPPQGEIVLTFAGGGDLRIKVECIEALLQDLGSQWETPSKPSHESERTG